MVSARSAHRQPFPLPGLPRCGVVACPRPDLAALRHGLVFGQVPSRGGAPSETIGIGGPRQSSRGGNMKRFGTLCLFLIGTSACQNEPNVWYKAGASQSDYQKDAYECERDTRMSAASFGTGFVGAANAETFATRCMNAKGYFLVHASQAAPGPPPTPTPQRDASGRLYGDGERVYCSFPNSPNPHLAKVELAAMPCSQGGGVILGPAT